MLLTCQWGGELEHAVIWLDELGLVEIIHRDLREKQDYSINKLIVRVEICLKGMFIYRY
jgi:hypothetical protein